MKLNLKHAVLSLLLAGTQGALGGVFEETVDERDHLVVHSLRTPIPVSVTKDGAIQTYALAGVAVPQTASQCSEVFDKFFQTWLDGFPKARALTTAWIGCHYDEAKKPLSLSYTVIFEALTSADVGVVDRYVARAEGRPFEDQPFHIRKVVGVQSKIDTKLYERAPGDDPGTLLATLYNERFDPTLMDSYRAIQLLRDAASGNKPFLDWVDTVDAPGTAYRFEKVVLPDTSFIRFTTARSFLTEDHRAFPIGLGDLRERDCRESQTGRCQ